MKALRVSIVVTLVALCVATNYALVGVPQVNVMDFIVFLGGFCFGPYVGALIGVLAWSVYGVINPYGFVPQIWLATMFSEAIYGIIGGLLGKNFIHIGSNDQRFRLSVFFGITGFFLTLAYDLIVSTAYALTFGVPIIVALIVGTPFHILHELSNTAIFGVGLIPLVMAIKKLWRN